MVFQTLPYTNKPNATNPMWGKGFHFHDKSKVQKTSPKDRKSEQSENGKRMGMGKEEMEKPEQDTWREGQNNGKGKRKKKILKNNTCHVSWNLGRQKEKKRSVGIIGNIIW